MSKTLSKGLYLLTLFNDEKDYLTIEDLSKRANIPKSTTYRLLKTLEEFNFIQKLDLYQGTLHVETDYYQLGLKCLELGAKAADNVEVRKLALPKMQKLKALLNECVQLIVRDEEEAVYIEKVESGKSVRLYTKIGRRAPLYAGACPRAILSFLDDSEIRRLLMKPIIPIGSNTYTEKEKLWDLILETRKRGYTYSNSELEDGSAAFATPILDRFGKVAASLSVAGLPADLNEETWEEFVIPMWDACAEISKELGFKGNYPYSNKKFEEV